MNDKERRMTTIAVKEETLREFNFLKGQLQIIKSETLTHDQVLNDIMQRVKAELEREMLSRFKGDNE